jgi:hypothetical protein
LAGTFGDGTFGVVLGAAFDAPFAAVFTAVLEAGFGETFGALAGAFAAALAAAVLSALRGGASSAALPFTCLEDFDFAATFFDFATALAMRCFDPQVGRRNRACYTTLGWVTQA